MIRTRYNYKADLSKDSFLIEVIAKTICSLEKLEKNEIDFDEFFTNQLAYIYHGLLVRKLNRTTKIFNFMWTAGTYYAPLSKYFYLHDFTKYKKLFKKEKNSSNKLLKAQKLLNRKFSGEIIPQENFMPMSPYKKKKNIRFQIYMELSFYIVLLIAQHQEANVFLLILTIG